MLVSIAAYALCLHWQRRALHLARLFVDYEPGIHYSQLQMQAGTSGDATIRVYGSVKQSLQQDPAGCFIHQWVPKLVALPDYYIHRPWLMPAAEQIRWGCRIGMEYPAPLVNHEEAARVAKE